MLFLAVLSLTIRLFGFEGLLDQQGIDLNMNALLVYAAVIGFSGSLISLARSKGSAKRMTGGAHVIASPSNETEHGLVSTGIGMSKVAIYQSPDSNAFATGMNRNNT